jgi:hypothetical protein
MAGALSRSMWRTLSGWGARREWIEGRGQEEPSGLRQGVKEGFFGLWRKHGSGGGRPNGRGKAEWMPARCSMKVWLPVHARERPKQMGQSLWPACEGSGVPRDVNGEVARAGMLDFFVVQKWR